MRNSNGKTFEQIVLMTQEALKTSETKSIKKNHIIIDSDGIKREIDIFISSRINNFDVNIAIECKDHSRKISIEKIESFYSKCLKIPEINKMVFISKKGFQSGAIKKAEKLGIELFTLEDLEENDIKLWIKNMPTSINVKYIGLSLAIEFIDETIEPRIDDVILDKVNNQKLSYQEFMEKVSTVQKPNINLNLLLNEENTVTYNVPFLIKNGAIIQKNKEYPICKINVCFGIEIEESEVRTKISSFKSTKGVVVNSISCFPDKNESYSFVQVPNSNITKIVRTLLINGKETTELIGEMKREKTKNKQE